MGDDMSDEDHTPLPITPRRQSGSVSIAEAYRAESLRTAERLEVRALARAAADGEPILRFWLVAKRLRRMGARFEAWHSPPHGSLVRSSLEERGDDVVRYARLYQRAHELLRDYPEPAAR